MVEGSTDIGGTRASVGMQAAEVLGIAAEDVRPTVGDTDSIGYTDVTGGSRVAYATGWAAHDAAQDVKAQMIERAATIWDVDANHVVLESGVFQYRPERGTQPGYEASSQMKTFASGLAPSIGRSVSNAPTQEEAELTMTFKELAGQLADTGGAISGRGNVDAGGMGPGGGSFAGNIVDLEVDPETGKVTILRFTAVQDAGKAVHPSYVEGQMQGGSVQGIGWALNEEYFMSDDGTMKNSSLLDYRMPTSLDLPMIDTVIVEVPSSTHPFGVRGVGEANIIPPTPAIANAIHDATGVRAYKLPINPGALMEAVWKQKK
jgi:CO/xanthine dehydrogenase Mo-binding subunit